MKFTRNRLSRKAFADLYNQHWERTLAVCYHGTENVELAKEMTQDIFKSIWERRATLEVHTSYERYLVRAAKLKLAEHYRNQATRKKHLTLATTGLPTASNTTEEDVNYSLLNEELNALVEQLAPQCQRVFQMSRGEGLTNKEIAQQLGVSQRAVEYHISNALAFLRKRLSNYNMVG
ncbi:MAG: RNA polymerase sigma-70 factor [Bacteroidota bacterium]